MRWPRGKYNGRRIVGLSCKVAVRVDAWTWRPRQVFMPCAQCWKWGPVFVWLEAVYE